MEQVLTKEEKNKKRKIKIILIAGIVIIIAIAGFLLADDIPVKGNIKDQAGTLVLVNKEYHLSSNYVPEGLVVPDVKMIVNIDDENRMREDAAAALEILFKEASEQGITLYCESGYRSYQMQKDIYKYNEKQFGKDNASKYTALPGQSEHQTGLCMDITNLDHVDDENDKALGESKEGIWLKDNAHQYGFILRYPENKTDITGYNYEPWHFRYVGVEVATKIYEKDIALEEYFTEAMTAEDIVRDYIPKPFDPVVNGDTLEYPGRWKGNVWPGTSQGMEKDGWVLYDAMGAVKYYENEINGQKYKISASVTEKGGPEEKDATTLIKFSLVKESAVKP